MNHVRKHKIVLVTWGTGEKNSINYIQEAREQSNVHSGVVPLGLEAPGPQIFWIEF